MISKKMNLKSIFILFIITVLQLAVVAQDVKINATLNKPEIRVGEPATFTVTLTQPQKAVVKFPILIAGDTLVAGVDILQQLSTDTSTISGNRLLIKQSWTITSFDSGRYFLRPLAFLMQKGAAVDTFLSPQLELYAINTIDFSKIDTAKRMDKELHLIDIKPIIEKPFNLKEFLKEYLWYIIFAIVIVAALVYYIIMGRKGKAPVFIKPKPQIQPHELALTALKTLEDKKLWQQNNFKQYHSELTEIVRQYIEIRFGFPALERTSMEILTAFKNSGKISNDKLEWLTQMFTVADFVKFAKLIPSVDENEMNMEYAYKFVKNTVPQPVVETKNEEGK